MNERLIKTRSDNVFSIISDQKRLCTKNLLREIRTTFSFDEEYRIWDPYHSKLAAIILKYPSLSIKKDASVLYLGAANGTTVSHVSDIVSEGIVFAVEFSPRAVQDLIKVSIPRMNLVPILADANSPSSYQNMVPSADLIYQDIAQREQAGIAIKNARIYLKKNGILILIIKSRSIDSTKKTSLVFEKQIDILKEVFEICELIDLRPYHSDHMAVVCRYLPDR